MNKKRVIPQNIIQTKLKKNETYQFVSDAIPNVKETNAQKMHNFRRDTFQNR